MAAESSGALQIWFVRHAESEINIPGNPRPVPDGGVTYPLTRKGVEQAKALAEATAAAPIVALYTSTYLRAVQTADAVAFRHDLTLSLAPEAVEVDLGITPGSQEDSRAVYVELARKWTVERDFEARHGEGESFADVQRRFLPFVREVMNRHAQDSGVVMIVAHAATIGFMVPVLAEQRAGGLCPAPPAAEHRHRQDRAARQPVVLHRTGWGFRTRSSAGAEEVGLKPDLQLSTDVCAGCRSGFSPTLGILPRCANSSGSSSR